MFSKSIPFFLVVVASLVLFANQPAMAHDKAEGTVVEAKEGKLTFVPKGKEKSSMYEFAKEATITVDGKSAKIGDLKKGFVVTMSLGEQHVIKSVVAVSKAK